MDAICGWVGLPLGGTGLDSAKAIAMARTRALSRRSSQGGGSAAFRGTVTGRGRGRRSAAPAPVAR